VADASREGPTRSDAWRGIVAMLVALVVVEVASRGPVTIPPLVTVTLLIGTLAVVAYAAFVGGTRVGLAAAALVALYTAHWVAAPGHVLDATLQTLQSGLIMGVIAATVAVVVGSLKRRTDEANARALAVERAYAANMERANKQLAAANESLEAFTYLVSHDLKEPVRSTDMLLQFLQEDHGGKLDPDARDLLARARRSNERLAGLLASLLELSRASRVDVSETTPVSVADALKSEEGSLRFEALAKERGARVDIDVADAPSVAATAEAVAQIFGNLIANAIKHNPKPQPRVRLVRAPTAREGLAGFAVEDDGPGFSPVVLKRFEDAEALPSSTKDGGFGLIIARRAVARLHGAMSLDRSAELGGARVVVELPVSPPSRA
jgi:signal transduction histidine kinase